jgi:hypothetical protein
MQDESKVTEQLLPLDDRLKLLIEASQQGEVGTEFDFIIHWTDKKLAGSAVPTTDTDIVDFLSFLGLAI